MSSTTHGFAVPYSRETSKLLIGCLVAAILWHLILPGWFYHTKAIYLEGPLPALAGAAVGLRLHRDDTLQLQLCGACGWAIAGSILAILLLGTLIFGPFQAIGALFVLLRDAFRIPFAALLTASGSPYMAYVFWMGIKTLLLWGAAAYLFLILTRLDLRGRLGLAVQSHRDSRAFNAEQRRQWAGYQKQYLEAVRNGGTPPPAPAGLVPPGAAPAGSWHHRAKFAYWAVRAGIAIAGILGLWTALNQQLLGFAMPIFWRGLFGGGG